MATLHEVHDEGRKHLWRLRMDAEIPVEWAVILGEIVHNLRSALDQSVYCSASTDQEARPRIGLPRLHLKSAFAQRKKKSTTEWSSTSGMYKIRGIGPGPHAFIEALQPYPQRCGQRRDRLALRLLHDFWNQDKHRLVHLWGCGSQTTHWSCPYKSPTIVSWESIGVCVTRAQ